MKMVKEVKKYVTSNGKEFDKERKAVSYEKVSEIVKKISEIFSERSFSAFYQKIIKNEKNW